MEKWRLEEVNFDEEGKKVLVYRRVPRRETEEQEPLWAQDAPPWNKSRKLLFNQNTHCGLLSEEGEKIYYNIWDVTCIFKAPQVILIISQDWEWLN